MKLFIFPEKLTCEFAPEDGGLEDFLLSLGGVSSYFQGLLLLVSASVRMCFFRV